MRTRTAIAAAGLVATLVTAACSQAASVTPTESVSATAVPTTSLAPPSAAACPNPEGGVCLGPLAAGTYSTSEFQTGLTYTVPDGWANFEDLTGNFLLVPPSGTLEGVHAGTSDYVGVFLGVAPAAANCDVGPEPGIDTTPAAMAAWYASLPGLDITEPMPVNLGGLAGVVLDLKLATGFSERCPYPGLEGIPMVPMIIGDGPASVHHVVCCDITTRLYLLTGPAEETIAIEVSEAEGGEALEELDTVVGSFEFDVPST